MEPTECCWCSSKIFEPYVTSYGDTIHRWHPGCLKEFKTAIMALIWREVGEYNPADVRGAFNEV